MPVKVIPQHACVINTLLLDKQNKYADKTANVQADLHFCNPRMQSVRSFTGMDRNGPNYRNGLSEWTLTCVTEYLICSVL